MLILIKNRDRGLLRSGGPAEAVVDSFRRRETARRPDFIYYFMPGFPNAAQRCLGTRRGLLVHAERAGVWCFFCSGGN